MKHYPPELREQFNALAEQLCISSITLGELHYGAEKSAHRADNLAAIEHFVARLDVLPFADESGGALRSGPRRTGARGNTLWSARHANRRFHARSEGLIVATN